MTVVAPVSALMATVLPVGIALADGERLSGLEYAGAMLCLTAIVLVSSGGAEQEEQRIPGSGRGARVGAWLAGTGFHGGAVAYGLGAGTAFGLFFLFLRNAGQSGTLWPVASARLAGLAVIAIAAAITRTRPVRAGAGRKLLLATVGSGVIYATANVCYVLATRAGLFGLTVVLTSLYPGITVVLARFVLGERMRSAQRAGLLLAGLGVVLVTA